MSRSGYGNWAERIARISIFLLLVLVALQYIASGKLCRAPLYLPYGVSLKYFKYWGRETETLTDPLI
jgi:hypothetical protein